MNSLRTFLFLFCSSCLQVLLWNSFSEFNLFHLRVRQLIHELHKSFLILLYSSPLLSALTWILHRYSFSVHEHGFDR